MRVTAFIRIVSERFAYGLARRIAAKLLCLQACIHARDAAVVRTAIFFFKECQNIFSRMSFFKREPRWWRTRAERPREQSERREQQSERARERESRGDESERERELRREEIASGDSEPARGNRKNCCFGKRALFGRKLYAFCGLCACVSMEKEREHTPRSWSCIAHTLHTQHTHATRTQHELARQKGRKARASNQ